MCRVDRCNPRRRAVAVSLALVLAGACHPSPESVRPSAPARFDLPLRTRLDAAMARHHVIGAAIAWVEVKAGEPEPVIEEAYLGRLTTRGAARVDADTVFQAASLAKPVFAWGVLELARNGTIALDRPLADYVSMPYPHRQEPWKGREQTVTTLVSPEIFASMTARMVLQHSTGLPNWARSEPLAGVGVPGTRWRYSGEGYLLLQWVLEQRTGVPLETFMRRLVFAPLGTSAMSYQEQPGRTYAEGHDRVGQPVAVQRWTEALAPSSLLTTVMDYAKFVGALLARDALPGNTTPIAVEPSLGLEWGLGWAIERYRGRAFFFHWGSNPGFASFVIGSGDRRQAIVVLTNAESGLDFADEVVQLLWDEPHPLFSFRMLHPT